MPNNKEVSSLKEKKPFPITRALSSKEKKGVLVDKMETSFRVYYGAKGASIPFVWESQPGTPKHPIFNNQNDLIVPPLTPPPSYCWTPSSSDTTDPFRKARKYKKFRAFLSSITRKGRSYVTPTSSLSSGNSYSTPLSWSSSSTSSFSPPSSPPKKCNKFHKRSFSLCSSGAKSSLFVEEEEEHNNVQFHPSPMCFGFKAHQQANNNDIKGY